ncbi:MAG: uncharacterized protein JWN61_2216 [Pseudonocardiales bacterium]|nr:uncharacterized protein [Pseudonocardiales bacterium]
MRSSLRPGALVGLAAAVLGLAVVAAATGGPWSLEERHYGSFNFKLGGDPITLSPMPTMSEGTDAPGDASGGGLGIDGRWFLLLLAVLVAAGIAVVVRRLWQRFRATAAPPDAAQVKGAGGVLLGAPEPELPPLLAAADVALAALGGGGDTDDAIVAAWVAVEHGAARSGVARHPAQTATEFTVAVLHRTQADPAAIAALRALYLRARFSEQPTAPGDVAEAARYVRALAAGWAVLDVPPPASAASAASRHSDSSGATR